MADDPMAVANQPPPQSDLGVVENVMRGHDMRKCRVKVEFVKRRPKAPNQPTRYYNFPTTVLANDFIQAVHPPPGLQLGSPKQLKARKAKLLNLQFQLIDLYDINLSIVKMDDTVPVGDNTGGVALTPDDLEVDQFLEPTTTGEETDDAAPDAELKDALDEL